MGFNIADKLAEIVADVSLSTSLSYCERMFIEI